MRWNKHACLPGVPLVTPTSRVRCSALLCPATEGTLRSPGPAPAPVVARWVLGGGQGSGALGVHPGGDSVQEQTKSPPHRPGQPWIWPPRLPSAAGPRLLVTSERASLAFVRSGSVCVEVLGRGACRPHRRAVHAPPGGRGREKGSLHRPQGDGGPVPWGRRLGCARGCEGNWPAQPTAMGGKPGPRGPGQGHLGRGDPCSGMGTLSVGASQSHPWAGRISLRCYQSQSPQDAPRVNV